MESNGCKSQWHAVIGRVPSNACTNHMQTTSSSFGAHRLHNFFYCDFLTCTRITQIGDCEIFIFHVARILLPSILIILLAQRWEKISNEICAGVQLLFSKNRNYYFYFFDLISIAEFKKACKNFNNKLQLFLISEVLWFVLVAHNLGSPQVKASGLQVLMIRAIKRLRMTSALQK